MDNELLDIRNGDGNREGDRDHDREKAQRKNLKNDEFFRIAIVKKVDEEIGQMIIKINEGFNAGKVNRPQLVNWILSKFFASFGEADIKAIRLDHFDEISLLDSILRQARETGRVPTEFSVLLQKHMGIEDSSKKGKARVDKQIHQ